MVVGLSVTASLRLLLLPLVIRVNLVSVMSHGGLDPRMPEPVLSCLEWCADLIHYCRGNVAECMGSGTGENREAPVVGGVPFEKLG